MGRGAEGPLCGPIYIWVTAGRERKRIARIINGTKCMRVRMHAYTTIAGRSYTAHTHILRRANAHTVARAVRTYLLGSAPTLFFLFFFFFSTLSLSSFWTSRGHRCHPFSSPVLAFNFYRA